MAETAESPAPTSPTTQDNRQAVGGEPVPVEELRRPGRTRKPPQRLDL